MLKVGIIGAGSIVESSHLPVLKNIDGLEIDWIFDQNITRSELLANMYGIKKIIRNTNWQQAIDNVDICLLTVPYGARRSYMEYIAKKEKALYVEKPFAISEEEHLYLNNLFPDYKIAVGFQRRAYKTLWQLKSIVESGILGNLIEIEYVQGYFSLKGGGGYLSDARMSGGGVVAESGIHAIDQILCLTQAKDVSLKKVEIFHKDLIEYDVKAETNISNLKGHIPCKLHISTLKNLDNGLKLIFDNAAIRCDLTPNSTIKVISGKSDKFQIQNLDGKAYAESVRDSFFIFWHWFIQAIELKTPDLTSGVSSLLTTRLIEKIYEGKK